jgi:AcrR family transcriptional regulator
MKRAEMKTANGEGRANQRRRTRKALLEAAARLMKQGRTPTLDEVAEEALVSRATAYRYFPGVEPLLIEAPLDVAAPDPRKVLPDSGPADPLTRVERVEAAFHEMIAANEVPLRLMLARSLERKARGGEGDDVPVRQNRRSALIEAALAPSPKAYRNLKAALALVIGTEAMVVFRDVLQMDEVEAKKVKLWAIRSLVEAARKPARKPPS